jgi:hypothetical protein
VFFAEQRATYLAHLGVLFTHVAGAMVALWGGPTPSTRHSIAVLEAYEGVAE